VRFGVFRLTVAITPQWLQIAGNSLSNDSSTGCLVFICIIGINSKSVPWLVPYNKPSQIFCDVGRGLHFCQCPTLQNRTVNTVLLLVAITRRRAVVGCHGVLFLVACRHALFEPNTILWAFHTIQPSSYCCLCFVYCGLRSVLISVYICV